MRISSESDLREVAGRMHDSEFKESDFSYDSGAKIFRIQSYSPETPKEEFRLEFYNVEEYHPLNLDRIREKKATGGIFNYIKIENSGLNLTIISQDLRIGLKLSKLDGAFKHLKKESLEK